MPFICVIVHLFAAYHVKLSYLQNKDVSDMIKTVSAIFSIKLESLIIQKNLLAEAML